jgi:hypothetical protein
VQIALHAAAAVAPLAFETSRAFTTPFAVVSMFVVITVSRCRPQAAGIVCSMSHKGGGWDNALAESFFATLKVEELRHFEFNTQEEAGDTGLRYICCYNAHRRHSTVGLLSPPPSANPLNPKLKDCSMG